MREIMTNATSAAAVSGVDLISDLEDDLLLRILSFLHRKSVERRFVHAPRARPRQRHLHVAPTRSRGVPWSPCDVNMRLGSVGAVARDDLAQWMR
jgi:hypothetical protein